MKEIRIITKAEQRWRDKGYDTHGECPECNWGIVVSGGPYDFRKTCTAYGQCEAAPG